MNRAFFLDRDGVINAALWNAEEETLDSPYRLEDFHLLPRAAEGIRLINDLGFLAIVVSNQPGVAKGKCTHEFLDTLDRTMLIGLAARGARLDGIYYCLHHPAAKLDKLRVDCICRKPGPGLLQRAAVDFGVDIASSYMVGDSERDVLAALAVECTPIFVGSRSLSQPGVLMHATDLLEAVQLVSRKNGTDGPLIERAGVPRHG